MILIYEVGIHTISLPPFRSRCSIGLGSNSSPNSSDSRATHHISIHFTFLHFLLIVFTSKNAKPAKPSWGQFLRSAPDLLAFLVWSHRAAATVGSGISPQQPQQHAPWWWYRSTMKPCGIIWAIDMGMWFHVMLLYILLIWCLHMLTVGKIST